LGQVGEVLPAVRMQADFPADSASGDFEERHCGSADMGGGRRPVCRSWRPPTRSRRRHLLIIRPDSRMSDFRSGPRVRF
jgi:hypothetical protein